jgi:DNA-binding transcriptional LysR family regulator
MAQGNLLAKLHFEQFNACQTSHYSDAVPPMVVAGRGIVCRPSRAARKDYDH